MLLFLVISDLAELKSQKLFIRFDLNFNQTLSRHVALAGTKIQLIDSF